MKKPVFDPRNPPTAENPLPAYGSAPSGLYLRKMMRLPSDERKKALMSKVPAMLVEIQTALSASLIPATEDEIMAPLLALFAHYPTRPLSEREWQAVAWDWKMDLAEVPADIIAGACQEWRRKPNTQAPTPGQLLELIMPVLSARRFQHRMASEWLATQRGAAKEERKAG